MQYQRYIKQKISFYRHFLSFFDDENQDDKYFENLINIIEKLQYHKNTAEFQSFLYLISEISKNHHRSSTFQMKMEKIISYFAGYIKQSFSKDELFKIFKKSPQILHLLLSNNIITVDDATINFFLYFKDTKFFLYKYQDEDASNYYIKLREYMNKRRISYNYKYLFFNYIKNELKDEQRSEIGNELFEKNENIFENFERKCRIGENDSYISQLIREDLIEEFVTYVTKNNIRLNSEINQSIFETNPLLIQKQATLIEYAAFFGSIQIFQYLKLNQIQLRPSLWIYAIHGNNREIIHILEENHIKPEDETYKMCLKESIKCHHNDIARYIQDNLMDEKIEVNERTFRNNPVLFGFHYYNYEFLFNSTNLVFSLFYACLYDHFPIVLLLIIIKKVDFNQTIIQNNIILIKLQYAFYYVNILITFYL